MNNKEKKFYPPRGLRPFDSGGVYLMSMVTLYIVEAFMIIILGFFKNDGINVEESKAVAYVTMLINQLAFGLTPFIYTQFNGLKFTREINFKKGISPLQAFILVVMALMSIVAFMPVTQLFIMLVTKLGYKFEIAVPNYTNTFGIFVVSVIFTALLPAIGEEILMRGFVAKGLRRYGILAAMLISSLIFATAHGNLLQLVYQFFLGAVLFTVYFATKSIYASMIIHFTNNATALLIDFILYKTTGSTNIEIPLSTGMTVLVFIAVSAVGCVLLTLLMRLFLKTAKRRQDDYVGGREIDFGGSLLYAHDDGSRKRVFVSKKSGEANVVKRKREKADNFITKYLDYLRYLNYSFEEEELERAKKELEEKDVNEAENERDKEYYGELLRSRRDKEIRWDRNLVIMAVVFNLFLLVINAIGAFS